MIAPSTTTSPTATEAEISGQRRLTSLAVRMSCGLAIHPPYPRSVRELRDRPRSHDQPEGGDRHQGADRHDGAHRRGAADTEDAHDRRDDARDPEVEGAEEARRRSGLVAVIVEREHLHAGEAETARRDEEPERHGGAPEAHVR